AAQVLGLLGIYRWYWAVPLTLALSVLAWRIYWQWGGEAWAVSFPEGGRANLRLDGLFLGLGIGLFLLLAVFPTAAWPTSGVSQTLHWDAGAYHFPKAVELFKHGHVYDLSIPYGEYPFGYESLLAFALLLTRNEALFGTLHALIGLFTLLGGWLLVRRVTRLPDGLIVLGLSAVFLSELFLVKGNPFYILLDQMHMIGKNDLFLAAGVVAALAHAPIGRERESSRLHLPGLVYASLLVLATKPSGMFVVAPLWLPVLWRWWQGWQTQRRLPLRELLFAAVWIVPGGLWAVRNMIMIGTIFPEGVWVMNDWSIANNLNNPFFYAHLPRNFIFLLMVLALTLVSAAWRRAPGWRAVLALGLLFVAFLFTPESGFQKTVEEPTRVAWRLGVALVVYELVALACVLEAPLLRLLGLLADRRWLRLGVGGLLGLGALGMVWASQGVFRLDPANAIVLRDEFREPVGVDGYHSAYDYIQKNIHDAVIEMNGGVFYYMYGPGYTNSPTKRQYPLGRADRVPQLEAQYFVIIPHGDEVVLSAEWEAKWKLLYRDPEGYVFERRGQ
ncbi:MAG: hypothetical protein HY835_03345, partial [Anaerolineae bacterium]|nr:hypothetical protein [Anaerolineae bacterium]